MTTADKIRIYDLARNKVPAELDEKHKKLVQAELTREILRLAPECGQNPKTASSSIDLSSVELIFAKINMQDIVAQAVNAGSDADSKPVSIPQEAVKPAAIDPKRLKIVRRITLVQQEEERNEEQGINQEPVAEESPAQVEPEAEPELNLQEGLQDILNKKTTYNRDSIRSTDMSNVRSIPLRPVSSAPVVNSVLAQAQSPSASGVPAQPYRIAKPTVSSQGMGRKKKRGSSSDERPKTIRKPKSEESNNDPQEITITKPMTVRELSQKINLPETAIITYFFMKKIAKTVNDILEKDLIIEFLEFKNYIVHTEELDEGHAELKSTLEQDHTQGNLITRPPVVTIMGHVDHGKTTLVDTIRKTKTKVVDQESGGITQHISTYRIEILDYDGNPRKITLLDTPGHEAFAAMRKRGANVTDLIVLIVAADDGVMPQTIECIKHIKESKIPFLVAVNKIDKPGANPDKVLGQLAEYEIITENYGGTISCSMISALNNLNIDELLEKVILVADAELSEKIRSNPNRLAVGTVIEAELSRAKGPQATIIVQNGTLHLGDYIAAGAVYGRVKAMVDETGSNVDEALPSTAVKVLGLSGVPKAGDSCKAYKSIQEAKEAAEKIADEELEAKRFRGIYTFASEIKEGQEKELRIIIKADVQGSAEAISHEINKLSTGEVLVKPISIGSGSITSNDVTMAERTGAVIVGFHVGTDSQTAKLAEKLGVKIKSYEIIYKLTEDLERAVLGMHEPEYQQMKMGEVEIRKIFNINGRNIAGSYVRSGKVVRNEIAKVIRDGVQIYEGKVDYLKRFKDDAREVKEGFECGLSFEKYNDLREGDVIECWTIKELARVKL